MARYFLLLDADVFHDRLRPALVVAWRTRHFAPCVEVCQQLLGQAHAFAERFHLGSEEPLLAAVARGDVPFDRLLWQHLAGELLWFGAADIPDVVTDCDTLSSVVRDTRVRDVCFGCQDLTFGGGFYRPDHAGWSDVMQVSQLAAFLAGVRPEEWAADSLVGQPGLMTPEDCEEELEYIRQWFSALVEMYRQAAVRRQVMVVEEVD
jgi:hypothetical protein